jgi:hypothetical protein
LSNQFSRIWWHDDDMLERCEWLVGRAEIENVMNVATRSGLDHEEWLEAEYLASRRGNIQAQQLAKIIPSNVNI